MRRLLAVLAGALLVAVLAGCAASTPSPEAPPAAAADQPAPAPAGSPLLTVVRLGLDQVPLVPLGLNGRQMEVPPVSQPRTVGFYRLGPRPGAVGPAVILGHVNGGGRPGAFARLDQLQPGDAINIGDGPTAYAFRVDRVVRVDKERFPTAAVYSDTPVPTLRLITCGGAFNGEDYRDNVIVYATAVPPPGS